MAFLPIRKLLKTWLDGITAFEVVEVGTYLA